MNTNTDTARIAAALAEPFAAEEVHWKPKKLYPKDNPTRALAIPYIDARLVMDRLDAVLGPANWKDEYEHLAGGAVLCKLSLRIEGEWLTKCDVGGESAQEDAADRAKSAVSDALKRAAVHWGLGRYLYKIPGQWLDFDRVKGFKQMPVLPAFAMPGGKALSAPKAPPPRKPAAAVNGYARDGTAPPPAVVQAPPEADGDDPESDIPF
jgi:hypothetical protein